MADDKTADLPDGTHTVIEGPREPGYDACG